MKITVFGLTHLGCVTMACCARYHQTTGLTLDPLLGADLNRGLVSIHEPGLSDEINLHLKAKQLVISSAPEYALPGTEVLWIAHDIKVDENDVLDLDGWLTEVRTVLGYVQEPTLVLISSQIPVGTIAELERTYPWLDFAYSPENLRRGKSLGDFAHPVRTICGLRKSARQPLLVELFKPFDNNVVFVSPETAEMVKHGLNGFLGLSIAYANELSRLCLRVGADPVQVAQGVKSDQRVGPKAYLMPGGPFTGGTISRDLKHMEDICQRLGEVCPVICAVRPSNLSHGKIYET